MNFMPANLASASPTTVLPNSLFTSFTETLAFPILSVGYHDYTIERSIIEDGINTPRPLRSWSVSKRLGRNRLNGVIGPDQFAVLRTFWLAVEGGLRPFYFYPDPRQCDATGSSPTGRIVAVFVGNWGESRGPVMSDVPLSIRKIA